MIKLKDILLEGKPPSIFIPRRIEDRIERMIGLYIRNGSKGDLKLHGLHLTKLPDILKNVSVDGSFYCYRNNLTSLEGAPKTVGENFGCSVNKLTSLEGSPKNVLGYFICSYNKLTSLEGGPTSVTGNFGCTYNKLTSLDGAPKIVYKDFYCSYNPGNFTEEQVRAVCDVKGTVYT